MFSFGSLFTRGLNSGYLVIDKSIIIKDLVENLPDHPIQMICYPPRAGKSYIIDIMSEYLGVNYNRVKNMPIMEINSFVEPKQYVVIKWIFASFIRAKNMDQINYELEQAVTWYTDYYDLLTEEERKLPIKERVCVIIKKLAHQHQKKVIILVDEFDTPFLNIKYRSLKKAFDDFFGEVLKLEEVVGLFFFGIYPAFASIAKRPIKIWSAINDNSLNGAFGFSETDIRAIISTKKGLDPEEALIQLKKCCYLYTFRGEDYYDKNLAPMSISEWKPSHGNFKVQPDHVIGHRGDDEFTEKINNLSIFVKKKLRKQVKQLIKGEPVIFMIDKDQLYPAHDPYVYFWTKLIWPGLLSYSEGQIIIPNKYLRSWFKQRYRYWFERKYKFWFK